MSGYEIINCEIEIKNCFVSEAFDKILDLNNPFKNSNLPNKIFDQDRKRMLSNIKKCIDKKLLKEYKNFKEIFLELKKRGFVNTNSEFEELINNEFKYKGFDVFEYTKDQIDNSGGNNSGGNNSGGNNSGGNNSGGNNSGGNNSGGNNSGGNNSGGNNSGGNNVLSGSDNSKDITP